MKSKTVSMLLLPITIVSVILFSMLFPFSNFFTQDFDVSDVQKSLLNPLDTPEVETPTPKNPTPETVRVLGATNSQVEKKQEVNFDTQTLYRLINSYRLENELNKLYINKSLEESALRKVADMKDNDYFNHTDQNQNESWYLFQASGYQFKYAGENLSTGINTPWQVFTAWQESQEHNLQLLKPEYLDMGIAVDCSETVGRQPYCLVVLHLGAK